MMEKMHLDVESNPGPKWDEFVSGYSGLLFHYSCWAKVLREGFQADLRYYCLMDGDRMVAGLPGMVLDFKVIRILHACFAYGGIIGPPAYAGKLLELLAEKVREDRIHKVRIVEAPGTRFRARDGWVRRDGKRHVLKVFGKSEEELWHSYRKGVRKNVRAARRACIELARATDARVIDTCYDMYLETMERNSAPAKYPRRLFHAISEVLVPRGLAGFVLASHAGHPVAAECVIYSKDTVHSLFSGSRSPALRQRPNDLLSHAIVAEALRMGKHSVDFMGPPIGHAGLAQFKEKWGAHCEESNTFDLEIDPARCRAWGAVQWFLNSSVGAGAARYVQKHRRGAFTA